MTKETRIGLVVGLGFIIMFGLVLTELTGTNREPAPPSLSDDNKLAFAPVEEVSPAIGTGHDVVPLVGRPISDPPVAAQGTALSAVKPQPPLPTKVETPELPVSPPEVVAEIHATPPVVAEAAKTDKDTSPSEADLADAAKAIEDAKAKDAAPPARQYTVQAKDTLIKIARKHYGAGKDREYKRIYEANKNILDSETALVAGQVLVIPPLPEAKPAKPSDKPAGKNAASDSQVAQVDIDQLKDQLSKLDSPAGKEVVAGADKADASKSAVKADPAKPAGKGTYVVRKGDNIYKIARRVLKDDSKASIGKLVNANKNKLTNPEKLQVGMKLEIPS